MSDAPEPEPEIFPIADTFGEIRVFPKPIVWTAGVIILAFAVIGLVQGVRGSLSGGAANGGQGEQPSGDAVSAQAAMPIPQNVQWSALNGPAMSSASPPKAAPAQAPADNNEEADSSAPDSGQPAESAAASAAPPAPVEAVLPAPTPQAASTQPPAPNNF